MNEASNKHFMNEAAPSFPSLSTEFESVDPYMSRITKLETHRAQLLADLKIEHCAHYRYRDSWDEHVLNNTCGTCKLIAEIEEAMK